LRCSVAKQQQEGDDIFAVAFLFAPSCAAKKKEEGDGSLLAAVAFFVTL
jgi:hypothetical protein